MDEFLVNVGVIVYLTLLYYLPDFFGGERNSRCHMDVAFANAMFGWVLMSANCAISAIFCVVFQVKKR